NAKSLFSEIQENNEAVDKLFLKDIEEAVAKNYSNVARNLQKDTYELRVLNVELLNNLMEMVNEQQMDAIDRTKQNMSASIVVLAVANLIAVFLGILFLVVVSRSISRNLKKVVGITSEIAKGNLTAADMDYNGKDEIGQLASAVNQMKHNLRSIVQKVANASESVSANSEELTQSSTEVKEGSQQIATTMEELSSGAETQAHSATSLSENMNDFVKKVLASEKDGQAVAETSKKVSQLTTDGTTLMKKSVEQMNRIDTLVTKSVNKVKGLDDRSDEISKLVLVIKDIADQTNLLSLNAAIEAARAGEQGKGFAVVADEVRQLAEQVATSVIEITEIVTKIQSETDEVVATLHSGYEEVKEGTEQIEKTGQNFETINESVSNMAANILTISNNLKEIADNSSKMNNLIEEIASVSEESASGVEQAAASAQQSSSSMEEISHNANELAKLAEQMNEEIKVFQL